MSHLFVMCLIIAVFLSLTFGWQIGPSLSEKPFRFISNVLFFDTIHIFFTFVFLWSFPEGKKWIEQTRLATRKGFWAFILFSVFVLTVCFSGFLIFFQTQFPDQTWVLEFIFIFASVVHRLFQTRGLAGLYEHELGPEQAFQNLGNLRKYLYRALIVMVIASALIRSPDDNSHYVIHTSPTDIHFFLIGCMYLAIALIFWEASRDIKTWRMSFKAIFLFRLLLVPLSFFSLAALLSLGAIHGVEHVLLLNKLRRNSLIGISSVKMYRRLLLIASAAGALLTSAYVLFPPTFFGLIAASFIAGVAHAHFVCERFLFRMRNRETRDLIGPLIVNRFNVSFHKAIPPQKSEPEV